MLRYYDRFRSDGRPRGPTPPYWVDTPNRADVVNTPGTADSGNVLTGNMGIEFNKFVNNNGVGTTATATTDINRADFDLSVTLDTERLDTTMGSETQKIGFRKIDSNNYWFFQANNAVQQVAGYILVGVYSGALYLGADSYVKGDAIRVKAIGDTLKFYLAGVLVSTLTNSTLQTATIVEIQQYCSAGNPVPSGRMYNVVEVAV